MMTTPHVDFDGSSGLRARLRRFFYAEEVPFGLALVRMLLPLALLGAMLPRWPHARELFSTDGACTPLWINYGLRTMLPEVPGAVAVAMATVLVAALVTLSLGWQARASAVIAFVLYTYLNLLDAASTMTKYSVIASHGLLLLSLSRCGDVWSLDAWLRRRRQRAVPWPGEAADLPRSPVWPRRLMQLLIGFVYFGAAITKVHTPTFFSGDQLQTWMLTNVNFENRLGEYMAFIPWLLVISGYITMVWEILFVFLAWRGWSRAIMISMGVVFHAMTWFTLGLHIFPLVCCSIYFSFLNENDVRRLARLWRRARRKFAVVGRISKSVRAAPGTDLETRPAGTASPFGFRDSRKPLGPVPSPAVFAAALAVVALLGIEIEYRMDPYGLRRPEGPYALKELDAEFVENVLLAAAEPIRPEDKFFDLQTGTFFIGGLLANPRSEFRHGETLAAQCTLTTPHEDMWVECHLHDSQGRIVDRAGQIAQREMLRVNFYYTLSDALEPGDYELIVKNAGREVLRRRITLRPRRAAVAN